MGLPRPVLQRVYRGADGRSDVVAKVYSDMSVSGVGKLGWHAVMSKSGVEKSPGIHRAVRSLGT